MKTRLLLLIISACLGACGLKGPLYLQDEDPAGTADSTKASTEKDTERKEKTDKKDGLYR